MMVPLTNRQFVKKLLKPFYDMMPLPANQEKEIVMAAKKKPKEGSKKEEMKESKATERKETKKFGKKY